MWRAQKAQLQARLEALVEQRHHVRLKAPGCYISIWFGNYVYLGQDNEHYHAFALVWPHIMSLVQRRIANIEHMCCQEAKEPIAHLWDMRTNVLAYLAQHCDATLLEAIDTLL